MSLSSFVLTIPCWADSLPLRVVCFFTDILLQKTNFFICKQLSFEDCFWVRYDCLCPLLSALGHHLMQTYACYLSLCYYAYQLSQNSLFLWCSTSPLGLIFFMPSLLQCFLSNEGGERFDKTFLLVFSVPRSIFLYIVFGRCGSILVFFNYRRKLL